MADKLPSLLVPGLFRNYENKDIFPKLAPWEVILKQLKNDPALNDPEMGGTPNSKFEGFYVLDAKTASGKSSAFVN